MTKDDRSSYLLNLIGEINRAEQAGDKAQQDMLEQRYRTEMVHEWRLLQKQFPDLSNYEGIREALSDTAKRNNWSFPSNDDIKASRSFNITSFVIGDGRRSIQIWPWNTTEHPSYMIQLFEYAPEHEYCHEFYAPTLVATAWILGGWYVDHVTIEDVKIRFPELDISSVRFR